MAAPNGIGVVGAGNCCLCSTGERASPANIAEKPDQPREASDGLPSKVQDDPREFSSDLAAQADPGGSATGEAGSRLASPGRAGFEGSAGRKGEPKPSSDTLSEAILAIVSLQGRPIGCGSETVLRKKKKES